MTNWSKNEVVGKVTKSFECSYLKKVNLLCCCNAFWSICCTWCSLLSNFKSSWRLNIISGPVRESSYRQDHITSADMRYITWTTERSEEELCSDAGEMLRGKTCNSCFTSSYKESAETRCAPVKVRRWFKSLVALETKSDVRKSSPSWMWIPTAGARTADWLLSHIQMSVKDDLRWSTYYFSILTGRSHSSSQFIFRTVLQPFCACRRSFHDQLIDWFVEEWDWINCENIPDHNG